MKYRRVAQPGTVEAVRIPANLEAETAFLSMIGAEATVHYERGKVHIAGLLARDTDFIAVSPGNWLVRDTYGNVSEWEDCFFQQMFSPL